MSEPAWVALSGAEAGIPTSVDGKWLKAIGGAMVWSDIPGLATPSTDWILPTLGASWVNYAAPYGPARFRKLASGLVVMEGLISSGTVNGTAFTLPVGYRPLPQVGGATRDRIFHCAMGGSTAAESVRINDLGAVRPSVSQAQSWVDLSGCIFYAGL